MHDSLLWILAFGFFMALIFGYISKRLGFSSIVGYMIAGFAIGPFTPGFVGDAALASELAEVGVILMMFGVGLHFDMKDLFAVKGVALPGAIIQSTVTAVCTAFVARFFGVSIVQGLILGIGLAVASTVVLLRILTDNGKLASVQGHVAVGWLVVEDILTVLVLVLLPPMASVFNGAQTLGVFDIAAALAIAIGKIALLWVIVLVLGGKFVPYILTKVARTRSEELFTLTVLVFAFITAVAAAHFFDASMALGAFLGGMVVGKSSLHHQARANIVPLKDAFSVLFFVAVGMLLNPEFIRDNYVFVIVSLVIVLVMKPVVAGVTVLVLGYSVNTALTVGTALAQVGEFSFILAQQAMAHDIAGENIYYILVICAIVSITLNPSYFKTVPALENFLKKRQKLWNFLSSRSEKKGEYENVMQHSLVEEMDMLAIVVGYGPIGRSITKTLQKIGYTPVIIEMNVDTVDEINLSGLHSIYGDASKQEILEAAGIRKAKYFVVTMSDNTGAAITYARAVNSDVYIIARTRYVKHKQLLEKIGADVVAIEEDAVTSAMCNALKNPKAADGA